MNVGGEFLIDAAPSAVFEALYRPDSFVKFVDGIHDVVERDSTHYSAVFETRVAYLKFRFNVELEIVRLESPKIIETKIEGVPFGMVGRLTATTKTSLEPEGEQTKVRYEVESALTGKLGSLGQPVLRSKAKELEKIFAARLREHFASCPAGTK
jgi:carbon monoxide dehydrogenase subunit G